MSHVYEGKVAFEDAWALTAFIQLGNGVKLVDEIKRFYCERRSCSDEILAFSLAVCAQCDDADVRKRAFDVAKLVCQRSEAFLTFCAACKDLRRRRWDVATGDTPAREAGGLWGRSMRRVADHFYNSPADPGHVAREVTRCKSYGHFSHAHVISRAHVKPRSKGISILFASILADVKVGKSGPPSANSTQTTGGSEGEEGERAVTGLLLTLHSLHRGGVGPDGATAAGLIAEHRLLYDHLPARATTHPQVWRALFRNESADGVVSHLVHAACSGLLDPGGGVTCTGGGGGWVADGGVETLRAAVLHASSPHTASSDVGGSRLHPSSGAPWWVSKYRAGRSRHQAWRVDARLADALHGDIITGIKRTEVLPGRSVLVAVSVGKSVHFHDDKALYCTAAIIFYLIHRFKTVYVVQFRRDGKLVEWKDVSSECSFTQIRENLETTRYRGLDIQAAIQWCHCTGKTVDSFLMLANHASTRYKLQSQECEPAEAEPVLITDADSAVRSLQLYRKLTSNPTVRLCVCTMDTGEDILGVDKRRQQQPHTGGCMAHTDGLLHLSGFNQHTGTIIEQFMTDYGSSS